MFEGTAKNERMRENDSCGEIIYTSDVQEPEKVNDICVKTTHMGRMDRGFTVCAKLCNAPWEILIF
jgi:hypothetical protein